MKVFSVVGMGIGLPSVMFTCEMILSVIVLSTSRSKMLSRTWSVSFVGIVPFTVISTILQNSASFLDLTACSRINDVSHSISPVIVIHVQYALSASVGTCLSKYTVFPSVLNGINAYS